MGQDGSYQATIDKLYALYEENGFISEEVALETMTADNVSFVGINRITDKLLAMGAIFTTEATLDDEDFTQTNYEELYRKVLEISPNQKPFIDYLKEIRPPQRREYGKLLVQYKSGNNYAYKRLFEMYLRVVVKIAMYYDYENTGIFDLDDAIQEGTLGLMQAIKSYDSSQNLHFTPYVNNWIRQHIDRAIADMGHTIRIPVHMQESINTLKRKREELFQQYGREPLAEEIALELDMSVEKVREIIKTISQDYIPIETLAENEESSCLEDFLFEDSLSPFEIVELIELKNCVNDVLKTISLHEEEVLRLRFGIDNGRLMTLEEIGRKFNVTRERIWQIEKKTLRKLRHPSRSKKVRDFLDE